MILGNHNVESRVFVLAEIGNNHEGDYETALKMISAAKESGADAVKFQTIDPEKLVSAKETARLERLRKFQFSEEIFRALAKACIRDGILFLSTPFSLESVSWLNELVPAFKVASGDNNFWDLLDRICKTGKPILLSSGMTDIKDIEKSAAHIRKTWSKAKFQDPGLALLHCVTSYPVSPEQANLCALRDLENLGCTVGYSDHTLGIEACLAAVALGARVIEKHFTLDKNQSSFRDHALSANPNELKELIAKIRALEPMLGAKKKQIQECERENLVAARRSLHASQDLRSGDRLESKNTVWVRPATGIPADTEETKWYGKRLRRDIPIGEPIRWEDIEN